LFPATGREGYFEFWNNVFNCLHEFNIRGFCLVNCPECGRPLKKEQEGEGGYFCENEYCNVTFVFYPSGPSKTRIAYTGYTRFKRATLPHDELHRRSKKQKLELFRLHGKL
jgi:hypothetical protein